MLKIVLAGIRKMETCSHRQRHRLRKSSYLKYERENIMKNQKSETELFLPRMLAGPRVQLESLQKSIP